MNRRSFFGRAFGTLAVTILPKPVTPPFPEGFIMTFLGDQIPLGWVRCDGSHIMRCDNLSHGHPVSDPGHRHLLVDPRYCHGT